MVLLFRREKALEGGHADLAATGRLLRADFRHGHRTIPVAPISP